MARYMNPTEEQEKEWQQWISQRPDKVRKIIEDNDFNPWTLYKLKGSGHRVFITKFDEREDGEVTLSVGVTGEFNAVLSERQVFGVPIDDLEECDLPDNDEILGNADVPLHILKEIYSEMKEKGMNMDDEQTKKWFVKQVESKWKRP